jgi:anti-sigma regulatory factor (Ser/Thr protein kinase)
LRELALHILDIAENSISADADKVKIGIEEDLAKDTLKIIIQDNGKGMDPETLARITDPFITSRTTRKVGLGIPFFKAAAEACEGTFNITSSLGQGTKVEAFFKHSHIDRMPLGDMAGTMLTLIIGAPDVHWIYEHRVNENVFIFDDQPIKEILGDLPMSEPAVMKYIRESLEEGIHDIQYEANEALIENV